jgi:hypothetical protein
MCEQTWRPFFTLGTLNHGRDYVINNWCFSFYSMFWSIQQRQTRGMHLHLAVLEANGDWRMILNFVSA